MHDDPCRNDLIANALARYRPLITCINILEIAATASRIRCEHLLTLAQQLSDGTSPLSMPNKILARRTRGYVRSEPTLTLTILKDEAVFGYLLRNPSLCGKEQQEKLLQKKRSIEDTFKKAHKNARARLGDFFCQTPESKPKSLFRFFRQSTDLIYEFVQAEYEKMTSQTLSKTDLWKLFKHVPDWPLFLAGWGHEIFARAISSHYGVKGKPGSLDLWSASYLPYCDVFVTSDTGGSKGKGRGGQYRALRLLNALVLPNPAKLTKTRIIRFQVFRQELLHS